MQANKNSHYQIKDKEKGFYHLRLVREVPTADERTVISDEKVQIYTVAGFKSFDANKSMFNFKVIEIIHDPTLEPTEPVTPTVDTAEIKTPVPPVKEKKQAYFGSEKWRQDMEAKKQLKNSKQ